MIIEMPDKKELLRAGRYLCRFVEREEIPVQEKINMGIYDMKDAVFRKINQIYGTDKKPLTQRERELIRRAVELSKK